VLHFSIQGLLLSSIGVFLIAAVRDSWSRYWITCICLLHRWQPRTRFICYLSDSSSYFGCLLVLTSTAQTSYMPLPFNLSKLFISSSALPCGDLKQF
jgi:hypothetical protein